MIGASASHWYRRLVYIYFFNHTCFQIHLSLSRNTHTWCFEGLILPTLCLQSQLGCPFITSPAYKVVPICGPHLPSYNGAALYLDVIKIHLLEDIVCIPMMPRPKYRLYSKDSLVVQLHNVVLHGSVNVLFTWKVIMFFSCVFYKHSSVCGHFDVMISHTVRGALSDFVDMVVVGIEWDVFGWSMQSVGAALCFSHISGLSHLFDWISVQNLNFIKLICSMGLTSQLYLVICHWVKQPYCRCGDLR